MSIRVHSRLKTKNPTAGLAVGFLKFLNAIRTRPPRGATAARSTTGSDTNCDSQPQRSNHCRQRQMVFNRPNTAGVATNLNWRVFPAVRVAAVSQRRLRKSGLWRATTIRASRIGIMDCCCFFGLRRQSAAATALLDDAPRLIALTASESGVALRLPPHSKTSRQFARFMERAGLSGI
jgi:hypothetical protein